MQDRVKKFVWLVIALILIGVIGWLLLGGKAGGEAEKYKAELRAKGEKISFADLGFPKPAEDGLSVMHLTNAMNRIRRANVDGGKFTSVLSTAPGRQQVVWQDEGITPNQSSNLMAWAELSALLRNVSNELAEVRLAAEQPIRLYGADPVAYLTNFPNVPIFPFVELRNAAQLLYTDGIEALHAGDLTRAREDHHTMIQLTEFNREDPMLVAAMIRVAITGLSLQLTWQALQHEDWMETDLAAMQHDWERVDLMEAVEAGFTGERAAREVAFTLTRQRGMGWLNRSLRGSTPPTPWERATQLFGTMFWNADEDELFALRHLQAMIESTRAVRTGSPWSVVGGVIQSQQSAQMKVLDKVTGLDRFRYMLSRVMLPNFSKAVQTTIRNETQRRLTITVIALKRFQLKHEHLPENLGELVPDFLASIPIDLMNAEPFRYRREGDTGFVLYSVGEDGKDDGGDPTPVTKVSQSDWWTGRDVVWPRPAD